MKNTFEVGKTYSTRSFGDYDCIFSFTVIARTAKFVTLKMAGENKTRRCGVAYWQGVEECSPLGRYSMSPIIRADRLSA